MLTVHVGRLRSRRGVSAIRGFEALGIDSLLDRVREANFLVGLTCGAPGTQTRGLGVGGMRLVSVGALGVGYKRSQEVLFTPVQK